MVSSDIGPHACNISACDLVKACNRGGVGNVCNRCTVVDNWPHFPERGFVIDEDGSCYLPFEAYLSGTGLTILLTIAALLLVLGLGQIFVVNWRHSLETFERAVRKPIGLGSPVSFSRLLEGRGKESSYEPLHNPADDADPSNVIWHGLVSWRLRQMRRWDSSDTPWVRYSFLRDFLNDFIIGVGLPMFYSFQSMVAVSAVLSALVLFFVQESVDLELVIEDAKAKRSGNTVHILNERHHETIYNYAYRMYIGLGILYVLLLIVACLHAKLQRDFAKAFDMQNSAMNDYTLKLQGLPRKWRHEENLRDVVEAKLRCKGEVIGTSIAYDLEVPEVQSKIWNMIERCFVQADVNCHKFIQEEENLDASLVELHQQLRKNCCGYPRSMASAEQLDMEKDRRDFIKLWDDNTSLMGSGHAFVVFRKKSHVDAMRMMYHGFWVEDEVVPQNKEQLQELRNALGPEVMGVPSSSMEAATHRIHAMLDKHQECHEDSEEREEEREFRYLNRAVVVGDEDLQAGTKVFISADTKPGQKVKVDRLIALDHTDNLEPTNFLWFNFGIHASERRRHMRRAAFITLAVFLVIVVTVYLPLYYFLNNPWSIARGVPGPVASQVQGIILGISGNILGFANWQALCRCGIFDKSEQDKNFLIFSLITSFANTVFFLGGGLYFHLVRGFGRTDMTVSGSNEAMTLLDEYKLYRACSETLVPGWLFSGMVIGKLMGWFVPLLQNFLLCTLIYRVRCLPTAVSRLLCAMLPGNPPPERLTARAAETIFNPPEVALAWEYGVYIVTPTVCYCMLFCLGPNSYKIFVYMSVWVIFCYALHRWPTLLISRKAMEGETIARLAEILWGVPLATVAAASSFWGVRCERLGDPAFVQSYWMVFAVFLVGLLFHNLALREITRHGTGFDLTDACYHSTRRRLKYTWFNCNPVHVLKSCYYPQQFRDSSSPLAAISTMMNRHMHPPSKEILASLPFEYGKEYLQTLSDASEHLDELGDEEELKPTSWFNFSCGTPPAAKRSARSPQTA